MRKKITAVAVSLIMIVMMVGIYVPTTFAGTTASVTVTFTPTSSIDISTNTSTLAYGEVTLNSNTTNWTTVWNDGTAYCSVTTQAETSAQNWSLVAGTAEPTGLNEFCININNGTSFGDAESTYTVNTSMPAAGISGNWTNCSIYLLVGTKTDKVQEELTFYLNMTGAAVT